MGEATAHLPAPLEDVWAVLTKLLGVPDGATRSDGGRTRLAVAEWLPPRRLSIDGQRGRLWQVRSSFCLAHFGSKTAISVEDVGRRGVARLLGGRLVLSISHRLLLRRLRRRLRATAPSATRAHLRGA